ncbi:MAG: response regulator [Candidatus Poribacteria bacterium]|nr:response regulator [Candidatus Poribacteria bacterium]
MTAKILFVDDEPDLEFLLRQKFRRHIRKKEFQFIFAYNGMEALEKLESDPEIDVVLSDINMPEMDGLTLLAKIAELNRLIRTVIISAYGDMQNIRTAMNRGAFDFLTKPIDFEDLEVTLNKTLQQVQQLKAGEQARKKALELESRNQFIRETFGRYVSDEVVAILLDSPEGLKLGGEKRKVTILMSDLRGFTPLAERLSPEQVMTFLNRYLETVVNVIMAYQGTIIEILGDGIMVIFGAPIWREDDAQRAVACAVAMQLAMDDANEQNWREDLPEVEMGIGIHTGELVVGNIGSRQRTKYTAVGSHVNLTARIESYTVGGQILISDVTLKEVGTDLQIEGQMQVEPKGVNMPIMIYEVGGIGGEYQLALPKPEVQLLPLKESIPLRYTVLAETDTDLTVFEGHFVKLSTKEAEVRSENPVALLSNLKMQLIDVNGEVVPGDVYGKVVNQPVEGASCFSIRFTSIPSEVSVFLQERLASCVAEGVV